MAAAPNIDAPSLRAIIQDVFLLPELPDKTLEKPFVKDLPNLLDYALRKCEALFPKECSSKLRQCRNSVSNFLAARASGDRTTETGLFDLLMDGSIAPIPLYLCHHNAGIIIRWGRQKRRVEIFQLSPKVNAVTSAVGRLRRKFPEMSVAIQEETAADEDFVQFMAETFAEMDKAQVPGLKPARTAKGKRCEEKCDATLCDHLVDIFYSYLLTEKSDVKTVPKHASIVKHTRDFVQYVDEMKSVTRRSPVWLLFKVVLQQELRENDSTDYTMYKQFMLVFLSLLLEAACTHSFDASMLHCMARKIGYRTWKLQDKASGDWMTTVENAVKRANNLLNTEWRNIVKADHTKRATKLPPFIFSVINCHVEHPKLDMFLAKVREKPPLKAVSVADPKSDIISWPPDKLPNMSDLAKESSHSIIFNLIKVEEWVEDYLQLFVEAHMTDISSCSDINKFATAYFKQASSAYKDYPDHMSVMYLTMLELWVACDRCAVARNPLLEEYKPLGVEEVNWEPLILSKKQEMLRLSRAERYLQSRSSDALNMVAQYGKVDCFGARFAQASKPHQTLMATIQNDNAKQMQEKLEELNKIKAKQKSHIEAHENGTCDELKCRVGTSSIPCERCNHLVTACGLTVQLLPGILPEDNNLAHTIVFELQLPTDISAWRDLCFFLLLDVAGHENGSQNWSEGQEEDQEEEEENQKQKAGPVISYIQNYPGLTQYLKWGSKRRIVLASRPEKAKDKRPVSVQQDTQLSDVCKSHPMEWKLFDPGQGKYIKRMTESDLIQETCSFAICDGNELLQRALTADDPDALKNYNELISLRPEAENVMMLKHNEELGSLYFGDHVKWPKILRELRGTSIDWAAPETFLLMSQVVLEAGPKQVEGLDRKRHCQLNDEKFATKLVQEIQRLLDIYTQSCSGRRPLAVFCIIAHKIITAAPESCLNGALKILARVRKTCFEWLRNVRLSRVDRTPEMLETQLEIALICAYTFAVDDKFLKSILSNQEEVNVQYYIMARATIYEHKSIVTSCFQKTLYSASLRLAVNAAGIMVGHINRGIRDDIAGGLYFIFERNMELSPAGEHLSHVSGPWVRTCTEPLGQSTRKILHLNLMTGKVLIDGKSPRHLPAEYVKHDDYRALFGNFSPAVTPVDHPIYQYQFRNPYRGFNIQVGMRDFHGEIEPSKNQRELHVRATKGCNVFVLIPRQTLSRPNFPFPKEYVSAHLHWHQITAGSHQIDFYPRQSPWDSSSIAWELKLQLNGWLLVQRDLDRVVMPTSLEHHQKLSRVFDHFITAKDFTVFVNGDDKTLEAHLATLGLNFFVKDGSSTIHSFEFKDMVIDHDYSLETLIGLQSKLILRNQHDRTSRTLLVADGEEQALRTNAGHTEVTVTINDQTFVQAYAINECLGQLRGNQTWRSKAYLAYLSALTSHCLPDPFTSNTGQETALEILTSGTILSFDSLGMEDRSLLRKISKLSPEIHLRKRPCARLYTLEWNQKLRPALHHEGYCTAVEKILVHAETLDSFNNSPKAELQKLSESERREGDAIRLACFRVTGYSDHNGSRDADYYFRMPERQRRKRKDASKETKEIDYSECEAFRRAYYAAYGAKYRRRFQNAAPSPGDVLLQITCKGAAKGVTDHYELNNLRYSGKWLDDTEATLRQDFCSIHKALKDRSRVRNKYRLRLWLSTVAFGMESGMASILIPILSAVIEKPQSDIQIPTMTSSSMSIGHKEDAAQLVTILHDAKTQAVPQQDVLVNATRNAAEEEFRKEQDDTILFLATQMAEKGAINLAGFKRFLDVDKATRTLNARFAEWNINKTWLKYCKDLCWLVSDQTVSNAKPPTVLLTVTNNAKHRSGHITVKEMMENVPRSFDGTNKWRQGFTQALKSYTRLCHDEVRPALSSLPIALAQVAKKEHEKEYKKRLDASIRALEVNLCLHKQRDACAQLSDTLQDYKAEIEERLKVRLHEAVSVVWRATGTHCTFSSVIRHSDIFPHTSPRWFLQQLAFSKGSKPKLKSQWCALLRQIAALYRDRQHMDRIIKSSSNGADLVNELQTIDRYSYDDSLFTDAVLLEIEQDICLRANQLETAQRMRDPSNKENAVMQLSMGEGKSSVIIPILAASLAQGKTLVRVFVGRHQSEQMMDTLTAAVGGLMNRSVFRMPYNRDSKLSDKEIKKVRESLADCVKSGGVLLLQPEHHQSLLLSACLNEEIVRTKSYMSLIKYLGSTCRDIIDECDELLSPRQELLYTIGTPGPVDFAPDRWLLIQGLLGIMQELANPREGLTSTKDVLYNKDRKRPDSYATFSFLSSTSMSEVLTEVACEFIHKGIVGFPTARYPDLKFAIKMFITERHPLPEYRKKIQRLGQAARSALTLVRGCIAGDILRAALLKRWRVDYGCDFSRTPSTRLAVPFAAKDVPKPRAEFSNVDLVIVLTQLSYYYGGLREQDVRDLIEHMCAAHDGHDVYGQWVEASKRAPKMYYHLPELKIINLQDDKQFQELLFPNIRYSVKAINYFLSRLVFPTELSAFSQHMAASGWDLAEKALHPKTGFSGTADQCALLPLDMKQQNLPSQAHTDALVLNNILHSDNTVFLMHAERRNRALDGENLIEHVIMDGRIRVIIDVGAQILKLSNRQVAERWLAQTKDDGIKAVVFFNESEVLSVLDGSGVTPLKSSMYSKKLDACAVFLDEAHTRGTDLRLPLKYKAAVTLGPGLTKDRLAQACMRMRSLGKGQALVFYVSFEVESNIRKLLQIPDEQSIAIDHIIQWSIAQTHMSITRQIPLWAKQGRRYKRQNKEWTKVLNIKNPTAAKYEDIEKRFIQNGINSVEKSYAPRPRPLGGAQSPVPGETDDEKSSNSSSTRSKSSETSIEEGSNLDGLDPEFVNALTKRCKEYGRADMVADDLDETCEREVAPEVEDEKQVCKPPKPKATEYTANKALESFIQSGKINGDRQGLERAFESLRRTTLARMLKQLNFPRNLLVSRDFAKAVDTDDPADNYQQHVAFLLNLKPTLLRQGLDQVVVIISQQDAEYYWETISAKNSYVSLHTYNAKVTPRVVSRPAPGKGATAHGIYPADDGHASTYPTAMRIALDLFAGQLYFKSYDEYMHVSSFLGLAYFEAIGGLEVDPDGFIPPSERHKIPARHRGPNQLWDTFESSPVPFFKHFLGVVRGHGAGIEHTHMGRILDGHRLGAADFPGTFRLHGLTDAVEEEKSNGKATRFETRVQRDECVLAQGKRGRSEEDAAGANGEPVAKRLCSEEPQPKREETDTKIKKEEEGVPVSKKIKTEVKIKEEEVEGPMGKTPQAPVKKTGKRKRQAEE